MSRIWLGSRASIWAHRGYAVRADDVICDGPVDALAVLQREFGAAADSFASAKSADGGTTYYYETQEDCDADETGSHAIAAITWETENSDDA